MRPYGYPSMAGNTGLNPRQEEVFQRSIQASPWFEQYTELYGERPNLNTPDYDYRQAWKSGVQPEMAQDGTYHWPAVDREGVLLKGRSHSTLWKEWNARGQYNPRGQPPRGRGLLDIGQNQVKPSGLLAPWGRGQTPNNFAFVPEYPDQPPIDLTRPIVTDDRGYHTELTATYQMGDKWVLIPTVVNGQILQPNEALKLFEAGANNPVGVFDTLGEADKYAEARSRAIGENIRRRQ